MILHPGILALLLGSATVLLMMLYASGTGLAVLRHWDFGSSSTRQLALERRTYLVSTILGWVLLFEIVSGLLFLYAVDDIHRLFPGAMCATGSLNANPVGWAALLVKIVLFFASSLWIVLNGVDGRAVDFPLVRIKYAALPLLLLLAGADLALQLSYFLGLDPAVITSCCGALFSGSGDTVASGLASLPVRPTMAAFYGSALLLAGLGLWSRASRAALPRFALTAAAAAFFVVSCASVISFISPYIYELPTHHCPFDILQGNYSHIGYLLYGSLFPATLFGILPGIFHPLKKRPSLTEGIERAERRWILFMLLGLGLFVIISSLPIIFGPFSLMESL